MVNLWLQCDENGGGGGGGGDTGEVIYDALETEAVRGS